MAYDGELVKMANGRWARFQRCQVYRPEGDVAGETMMLIAVELDERYQRLLDEAMGSPADYSQRGLAVQSTLDGAQRLMMREQESSAMN